MRGEMATVNGTTLRFAVSGKPNGPAVILHHPLAARLEFWDPVMTGLEAQYRVVRLDARGHGESAAAPPPYSFDTLARDVVALMDHVGIKRAHFVGLSMGGMVGQRLGLDHAARFHSLSLVATTSRIPADMQHLWRDRVVVAREKGMASQVEPAMARWVTAETKAKRPDLVATFGDMIERTSLNGYAGWCGAIHDLNFTDQLSGIRLPTLVISGELDPATPPTAGEAIHKAISGSQFVVIPAVAHMLSSEAPDKFLGHLLPFLAKHTAVV